MKKTICMLSLLTICTLGCDADVEDKKPEQKPIMADKGYSEELLKEKLFEYGKLIYENDVWLNGGIKPMTYTMSLREMSERNHFDITMFYNTVTEKSCDIDNTRVFFIVTSPEEATKTEYSYSYELDCD